MKIKMFRDKVLFGAVSGVFANIVMDIPQYPLWKLKFIKHPLAHYAGSLFVDIFTLHHTWYGSVASFLADYIYSAILGILFIYLVDASSHQGSGKGYFLAKGLLYGALLWLISFGGLRSLPIVKLREVIPSDGLLFFPIHLLFGLVLGWLAKKHEELVF